MKSPDSHVSIFVEMNRYHLWIFSLVLLVLLSACSNQTPTEEPATEYLNPPDRVDVVYFHLGEACACMDPAGDSIQSMIFFNFQDEVVNGTLTFQRLRLDEINNADIAAKYNATPVSLFLNIVRGDTEQVVAVPEIWPIRYESEAIADLVEHKIRQSLEGNIQ